MTGIMKNQIRKIHPRIKAIYSSFNVIKSKWLSMISAYNQLRCRLRHDSLRISTWLTCGFRHRAELNPFRVLWINPDQIIHKCDVIVSKNARDRCHVIHGDWDTSKLLFEDHGIYTMLKERFNDGALWEKTQYYPVILQRIKTNGTYWNGCCSEMDVIIRCGNLDQLYNEIKNSGYRVPSGLTYGVSGISKTCRPEEIAINIGRDGRFFYENGRHRLSIAKILSLPLIPVRIVIRHKLWQEIRDEAAGRHGSQATSSALSPHLPHPDISYLLS
jgi:hypothetical protein